MYMYINQTKTNTNKTNKAAGSKGPRASLSEQLWRARGAWWRPTKYDIVIMILIIIIILVTI